MERREIRMKKSVVIRMQGDFEARPIANMVQTANCFCSRIYLDSNGAHVNVKSIMGMMSLALMNGDQVVLDVEGADEEEALAALEKFLAG